MKRFALAAFAAFAFCAISTAQTDGQRQERRKMTKEEMVKHRTDRMQQRYGLDEAQAAKVLELNTKFMEKMPMGGPRGDFKNHPRPAGGDNKHSQGDRSRFNPERRDAHMKEMQANREAYEKELQGILTTEQYSKYQEDIKAMRQRGPQREEQ